MIALIGLVVLAAGPAVGQSHDHQMPGMVMPEPKPEPAPAKPEPPLPPTVPATYADRIWGAEAMRASRARLMAEHGGGRFGQVFFDLAEVTSRDSYRWDGEGWYGGDVDRVVVKSDGEGRFGGAASADVQLLYSRAIGPYFDLQAGVRQDLTRRDSRTYAALGIEGLAPYWFEIDATAFLSDRGEVRADVEGHYDQRITQRLILQPRIDLTFAAQGSPAVSVATGLRLRYEIARAFAPYVGVHWERRSGASAGDLVAGMRFWF